MLTLRSSLETRPLWWLIDYLESTENEYVISNGHLEIVIQ